MSERLFADFYDELHPTVLRFFAKRTRDGESAFDLTAETFAKAFEKREQFRGITEEEAAGWLRSIARNELAKYNRTRTVELGAPQRLGFERPATPNCVTSRSSLRPRKPASRSSRRWRDCRTTSRR